MKQSYNYDAQLGGDVDDLELCHRYGIDTSYAYTPEINDQIKRAIREETVSDLIQGGYSEGHAKSVADSAYNQIKSIPNKL